MNKVSESHNTHIHITTAYLWHYVYVKMIKTCMLQGFQCIASAVCGNNQFTRIHLKGHHREQLAQHKRVVSDCTKKCTNGKILTNRSGVWLLWSVCSNVI